MSARVLFHIDINAFYASAHLTIEPELEGKPVVVCRDVQGSVVTTASYEARQYGIGSAMPLSQAKRLCDDLVVVELDFELYNDLSQSFVNIIKSYSKTVEQASIDEVYVDVTDVIKTYDKPLDLAINIQKQLLDELKLPVSIGVGPNKFLAKMASDMDKPLGITVLRIREVETKLWPLAIDQMHGIGKKTVPRLKEIGVHTIGDLNNVSFDKVKLILGNRTQVFIDYANGLGSAKLNTDASAKSIGQSQTFSKAIFDYDELKEKILKEISQVESRAKASKVMGKTIQFSIRFEDMKPYARSITLDHHINDKEDILERVMGLFSEFEKDLHLGVNFISVTLANLKEIDEIEEQLNLFNINKETDTDHMIDELNNMFGDVFSRASTLLDEDD